MESRDYDYSKEARKIHERDLAQKDHLERTTGRAVSIAEISAQRIQSTKKGAFKLMEKLLMTEDYTKRHILWAELKYYLKMHGLDWSFTAVLKMARIAQKHKKRKHLKVVS